MHRNDTRPRHKRQRGFALLEVMIAGAILVIGLLALTALFITAVGNNGRSRVDSSATMLAQSVIEQITAKLARGGPLQITDCKGNNFVIGYDPGPLPNGNGARLSSTGTGIDFSETSPPDHYWTKSDTGSVGFVIGPSATSGTTCSGGGENGTTATYDVRWNIAQVGETYLVTVSGRPLNMQPTRFTFSLPVTLRAYVGKE